MNVIERINMLKKMVKEAERIVAWQESIFTDFNVHRGDTSAHHTKYTNAEADARIVIHAAIAAAHHPVHLKTLADHVLGTVVPHDALASLTEKAFSSLTGRWTLSQAHRGTLNKIMVFQGPDADPVEEDKPVSVPFYSETDDLSDVSLVTGGVGVPPSSWATLLNITSGFRLLNGIIFGREAISNVRITIDGGTPQLFALRSAGVYTAELDYLVLPPIRVDTSFKVEAYNTHATYNRGCQVMFWARAL